MRRSFGHINIIYITGRVISIMYTVCDRNNLMISRCVEEIKIP